MKIAFATTYNVADRTHWPRYNNGIFGAGAKIAQLLTSAGVELDLLGPLTQQKIPITRLKWLYYRHLRHQDYYSWAEPRRSRDYARQIAAKLTNSSADLLLCPEDATLIAAVNPDRPMVLWVDAALGSLIDFYDHLSHICAATRRQIYALEKQGIDRCTKVIVPSDWAANRMMELYCTPAEKLAIVPRGANLESGLTEPQVETLIQQKDLTHCQLLFIGVEWQRKGGDLALAVAERLNQQGLPTDLHVVGCEPEVAAPLPPFVKTHGFIDRARPEGQQQLTQLMLGCHFLILPTRAETFGIVFCEASSFALPCLGTKVGGVPSAIRDGVNGITFDLEAEPEAYCHYIRHQMEEATRYQALALSSFQEYKTRLNWDVAGQQAMAILREVVGNKR